MTIAGVQPRNRLAEKDSPREQKEIRTVGRSRENVADFPRGEGPTGRSEWSKTGHRYSRVTSGSNPLCSCGESVFDRQPLDPCAVAWLPELAAGRARSLRELAERDGITRRYVRRLVDLAFLSPELVEAILQGRQPVELTATRLTELDLPLDWTDQRSLLAS